MVWASTCVVGKKSGDWSLMDNNGEMTAGDDDDEDREGQSGLLFCYRKNSLELLN